MEPLGLPRHEPRAGRAPGDGPPVVLLHGLSATRRNVVQGSRALVKRGYRLISYDARGHGAPRRRAEATSTRTSSRTSSRVLEELDVERPGSWAARWAPPPRWRSRSSTRSACRRWCRSRRPTPATPAPVTWTARAGRSSRGAGRRHRGVHRGRPARRPPRALARGGARGHAAAHGAPRATSRRWPRRCARSRTRIAWKGLDALSELDVPCSWSARRTTPTGSIRSASPRSTAASCRTRELLVEDEGELAAGLAGRPALERDRGLLRARYGSLGRGRSPGARSSRPPRRRPRSPGSFPSTGGRARARPPARPGGRSGGGCPRRAPRRAASSSGRSRGRGSAR